MIQTKETLCVTCDKACRKGCSWADELIPVDGWTAEENKHGYLVIECPEYQKEDKRNRNPDDIDNDGLMNLLEAFMKCLRYDYVHGCGRYRMRAENRMDIERFLRSKYGQKLLPIDHEDVIRKLRRLAAMNRL